MATQKERVFDMLEEAGDKGVTNIQLNKICFRYGARIKDLRDEGILIRSVHIKGSVWRFYLQKQEDRIEQLYEELAAKPNLSIFSLFN